MATLKESRSTARCPRRDTERPVMSGVPQGLLLGQVLFNIFVGDMDSGIEYSLSKFPDDTKLCGVVNMLEGRDTIQRDLDRLETWACVNLMKFNQGKCKILHLGHGNPKHKSRLGRLRAALKTNNLGVLADNKLNMNSTWSPSAMRTG
ncbi:rna-directed dna polymerase from mobile element jockey-like [Limosa lapponica baueri]|uniref:Rna-directed dna polymerase from mobile element jockey-like n=1 Tax=Limosa lapponica baueri TaxID=1758121 RepID=A0A2I0T773_LIMLA|nr:rna-directed dna polymerase from mobile element jockey-like [Limosa lapponica baueri]